MTPQQSRMARASLKWTIDDLAAAAGVGRATVARFEGGQSVMVDTIATLRSAFDAKCVKFVDDGPMAGAVYGIKAG